jgi:hypothetical protein
MLNTANFILFFFKFFDRVNANNIRIYKSCFDMAFKTTRRPRKNISGSQSVKYSIAADMCFIYWKENLERAKNHGFYREAYRFKLCFLVVYAIKKKRKFDFRDYFLFWYYYKRNYQTLDKTRYYQLRISNTQHVIPIITGISYSTRTNTALYEEGIK